MSDKQKLIQAVGCLLADAALIYLLAFTGFQGIDNHWWVWPSMFMEIALISLFWNGFKEAVK